MLLIGFDYAILDVESEYLLPASICFDISMWLIGLKFFLLSKYWLIFSHWKPKYLLVESSFQGKKH